MILKSFYSGSIIRCIEGVEKLCEGVLRLGAGEWPPVVCPDVMAHFRMCSVLRQAVGKERDPKVIHYFNSSICLCYVLSTVKQLFLI